MPSDLCFIYNNAVDSSSITASTTFGDTSAQYLKNDVKGMVHKSTENTVTYTCTWGVGVTIEAIALPAINVPVNTTVSVSINSTAVVTNATPFQYTSINTWYIGSASANEFSTGRYSIGCVILSSTYTNVTSLVITITLPGAGTIECSRLIAGRIWRPERYVSNGIEYERKDTSTVARSVTGNLLLDKGYQCDQLSFDIKYMESTDRENLFKLLRMVGSNFIFVTIFPSAANSISQDYSIYGKISSSPITYEMYNIYSYTVSIEGW